MEVVPGPSAELRRGLYRIRRTIKQTNVLVISDRLRSFRAAIVSILYHRRLLEAYIRRNPRYRRSLSPVKVGDGSPRVARVAAEAAEIVGVGPMAAIPGALADLATEAMARQGGLVNVVENGGEISGRSVRPVNVGVYAGPSPLSGRIGFRLRRDDFPIGIATSSATVGNALTFGRADAAIAVADSASLADAAATAICNAVRGDDQEGSLWRGLEVADTLPIRSALVIRGGYVGTVGRLPRILLLDAEAGDPLSVSLSDGSPDRLVFLE